MTSYINTNLGSMNSQRHLSTSQAGLATSLERLSSGLRINNAKDDAAGMSIAERFTSQIKGVNQAGRNANDGVSMTQVAEGSLATTSDALQRVRELAVQAANATNTAGDRKTIQDEVNQLLTEIDRTAQTTQFNGTNLMDGTASNMEFQVGANANQTVSVTNANFRTNSYGGYRMGALVAVKTLAGTTDNPAGDLVAGSATATNFASTASATATSRVLGSIATINGSSGTAAITIATGDSAKTVAASINAKTLNTNVTATATTSIDMTGLVAGAYSFSVSSNNTTQPQSLSFALSGATADDFTNAANSFNIYSSSTGVTAKLNDAKTGITLTNESGQDITLTAGASNVSTVNLVAQNAAATTQTLAASGVSLVTGQVSLNSDKSFGVTSTLAGATTDFFVGATSTASLQAVNNIDVSSTAGATRALSQVDAAIASIDKQRGLYGAIQSRFANAVSNLQSASENMSASRSRIQDTDFASETAQLTRGQILQQAGTAMLAQANSMPNGVLALLRG